MGYTQMYTDVHMCIRSGAWCRSKIISVLQIEENIVLNQSSAPKAKRSAVYIQRTVFFFLLHHLAQKMNTLQQMSWKTAFKVEAANTVLWFLYLAYYSEIFNSTLQWIQNKSFCSFQWKNISCNTLVCFLNVHKNLFFGEDANVFKVMNQFSPRIFKNSLAWLFSISNWNTLL